MPRTKASSNLSSARELRQSWRRSQDKRTHQQLHDAADWVRSANVDASHFALVWISVGLRIAADKIEELAAEMLVEDIIGGDDVDRTQKG